jgi:serine/threonine protein phosphatase 1
MDGLTYAIGDLHGRNDLLTIALAWIERHSSSRPSAQAIFLGDYIDRGPDSRGVVERLMQGPSRTNDSYMCLMGNHEEMLLDALQGPDDAIENWLRNGGEATLASYGRAIDRTHLAWIQARPLHHEDQHRFFVHAGVNPRRPLARQTTFDMLWIREPFLSTPHDFGKHVVHGHTIVTGGPELGRFRTNLDVGAYRTGRLCIAVFDPASPGGPVETAIVTA